jgi:ubiquitin-protein ligase E3 C
MDMANETAHQLSWYSFIGRILGKALYDGILVDVSFAGFFRELPDQASTLLARNLAELVVAKWLGRQSYLDDLNSLDAELYKGLTSELLRARRRDKLTP